MKNENRDYFVENLLASSERLNALDFALQSQLESAKVNFDLSHIDIAYEKVVEEYGEMNEAYNNRGSDFEHFKEELWDCFFALVNLCRWSWLNAEELLQENVQKYLKRCKFIEDALKIDQKNWGETSKEDIKKLWKEAKLLGL